MQEPAGDEASRLRDENAALRAALNERLDKLDAAQREAFYAKHAELAAAGNEAGEAIPQLEGAPAPPPPPAPKKKKGGRRSAKEAPAAADAPAAAEEGKPALKTEKKIVMEDAGVAAVVEVESDNTLVFKFGPASGNDELLNLYVNWWHSHGFLSYYHICRTCCYY